MTDGESRPSLSGPKKVAYGVGLSAEGIKQNAFNVFLLFFYQQVVGLDPALCGLALFISLCVDAVIDPIIGTWSDQLSSRLGRRHPFMYAGILPLGACYYAVFQPPFSAGQAVKFAWLLVFAIGARVSMALFVIPHQSLVPELTADSAERTSLMSLRTVFAWIFGLTNGLLGYTVFLRSGLGNREGYSAFAAFGSVTMIVTMTISALLTQRAAMSVRVIPTVSHASIKELPRALGSAMKSASYRSVVIAGLFLSVGYGLAENMNNYMNTFFWGFSSTQIGEFIFVIFLSSLTALVIARPLATRFETHHIALASGVVMTVLMPGLVVLRLIGALPPKGDPRLFEILAAGVFVLYTAIILGMALMGTMIANVTDEREITTGERQEGLLFSAAMFISKAASGLGVLVAGVVVKAARFPENASPGTVDASAVRNLGIGSAWASLLLGLATIYCFSRFTLTRKRHTEILTELAGRRRGVSTPAELHAVATPSGTEPAATPLTSP